MTNPVLLQTDGLTKRFGQVTVLDNVSFSLREGEIHALVGANGAGKSTLCKVISGLLPATSGTMRLGQQAYSPGNKRDAEVAGIEIVQQELNLIPTLSVAENLFFGRFPSRFGVLNTRQLNSHAHELLKRFGLGDLRPETLVGSLGVGRQQMVEIVSAFAQQCKLLILDEPTAALTDTEADRLFEYLSRLRDEGAGIIYISHRLDEVARICDRTTVLRDGEVVLTSKTSDLTTDEMVSMMSGEEKHSDQRSYNSYVRSEVAMDVQSLSSGIVRDVSLTVHRGERFGITGLVGSGRTELLRAIFGADLAQQGRVVLPGTAQDTSPRRCFSHPKQAVQAGLAMVTEDRKRNGLLLTQSIACNSTLSCLRERFSWFGLTAGRRETALAEDFRNRLQIRCEDVTQQVSTLSGGNQQKVAVAKWIACDANVLLFDEPTRGIDVASRSRIHRLLESLASEGKACVIVSSDLDELFDNCDVIAVMCDGKIAHTFRRGQWTREQIVQASFANYLS